MCVWNILEQVARFFWGVCTVYWDPVGICLCVQHLQVLLYLAIRSLAYLRICEHDGMEYHRHKEFLQEPGNISFILNTDGVSTFKSSTITLWPIWLVINELPPEVRLELQTTILDAIIYYVMYLFPTGSAKTTSFLLAYGMLMKSQWWPLSLPLCWRRST